MQEGADRLLLVEAARGRKSEHVDAAKLAVDRLVHKAFYGGNGFRISRLPQNREQWFGLTHVAMLGLRGVPAKAVPSGTGHPAARFFRR